LVYRLRVELSLDRASGIRWQGYPTHERGVTSVAGLYFLGLPWLYTWGSGRFSGIARDAAYLSDAIANRRVVAMEQTAVR
jgi:putative flavoprotein involved in K+ transport